MSKPQDKPSAEVLKAQQQAVHYELEKLIAGITPKNRHPEISFGKPTGKEAL